MSKCADINKKKKNKTLIANMAEKFAGVINEDVRFFWKHTPVWGLIYDFEPAALNQHTDTTIAVFTP